MADKYPGYIAFLFICVGIFFYSISFLFISGKPKKRIAGPETKTQIDLSDYAPGYPNYSISAIDQLTYFPRPRFKSNVALHRNFSWYDFLYMSYEYTKVIKTKSGIYSYADWGNAAHAKHAIAMNNEMVENWNYYFNIPTPTYGSDKFSNPETFAGNIVSYVNLHPEIPTCAYIFWGAVNPSTIGYSSDKAYIKSADAINPCKNNNTYPLIQIDGRLQRKNLEKVLAVLPNRNPKKKIDFINENGEIFGSAQNPNGEGYRDNPLIACIQKNTSTARQDRGHWQYEVFNAYKKQFIKSDSIPGLYDAEFSFYQISAFLPFYYGEYSEMRKINQFNKGNSYSTPDFYPGDNRHGIFERYAAYHGLNCIEEGRKREIEMGDTYFSPFVCAGWWEDSLNYRPAPWLASLKALSMMGAEYFYPAFFNMTNPSAEIPINPCGYIYQVAMPSYAQALTSRYSNIFYNSKDFVYQKDDDMLAVYREDNKTKNGLFVINANWFKNGIGDDAKNILKQHYLSIGNNKIKINYRRQGSVYIYDCRNPSDIIFYQLDGWHESTHPYYWSRDFVFEAELHDDSTEFKLTTELPKDADKNDFTSFTTSISFSSENMQAPLVFNFQPTEKDTAGYYLWIRARSSMKAKKSFVKIDLDEKEFGRIENISSGSFAWYRVEVNKKALRMFPATAQNHTLNVFALNDALEIDKIILSLTPNLSKEKRKE